MDTEDTAAGAEIPQTLLRLFADEKARPKVIRTYDAQVGWLAYPGSGVLTWQTVDELIAEGKTSVDVKWRSRRRQVSLLDLRPSKSAISPRTGGELPLRRRENRSTNT